MCVAYMDPGYEHNRARHPKAQMAFASTGYPKDRTSVHIFDVLCTGNRYVADLPISREVVEGSSVRTVALLRCYA